MNYVPGRGPSDSRLVVVGDMPGAGETLPFTNSAGKQTLALLEKADEKNPYMTNVIKHFHPFGKGVPLDDYRKQLEEEIRQVNPCAILAVGGTALEVLTGYKGIENYRGSILQSTFGSYKVIPTINPGSILRPDNDGKVRSWKDLVYIQWDVNRAVEQSKFRAYNPPKRNLQVIRSSQQLYSYLRSNQGKRHCALDIETFRTVPICLGIAFSRTDAVSVPFFNQLSATNETGMTRSDIADCWQMCAELLANRDVLKYGQNFVSFDSRQLMRCVNGETFFGMKVNSFYFDTQLGFRILYPELSAKLQFITSVLTEEPYYKDEGKEYNPKKDKFDRLLLYNAKDAVVTFEAAEVEIEELDKKNRTKFYFDVMAPIDIFYHRMELRGILRDNVVKHELAAKYSDLAKELQAELDDLTKEYMDKPVNVNSNAFTGDVPQLVYAFMKCPARKGCGEIQLSGLLRNVVKDPKKKQILGLILMIRKVKKVLSSSVNAGIDYRGRLLTSFRRALETGRTSTSLLKPPMTTDKSVKMGTPFQTITKHGDVGAILAELFPHCKEVGADIRRMYIPDPGFIFIEPDLSQAEARVVALLAEDQKMLKMFEYKVDLHRVTQAWIEDRFIPGFKEFDDATDPVEIRKYAKQINDHLKPLIDDDARQMGKKFRHAGHYAMQKATAAEQIGLPEWKAGQILKKFHATNPNVEGVFHRQIIEALGRNQRTLVSPNGRTRQFLNKWGEELWKEAYAQIPQSTVSDQTKMAMMAVERRTPIRMYSESHDSWLGQIQLAMGEQYPFRFLDGAIPIIKEEMERPIDFKNCTLSRGILVIPSDISIGKTNWLEMEKYA